MKRICRNLALLVITTLTLLGLSTAMAAGRLQQGFEHPPTSARPWVYWFWLNGNITRHGIAADLQAMKRVGIGGVLIMEVDQGVPVGPVDFMSSRWQDMFKYVVKEAGRLGIEVNMNDDAGWNGSGGPWIKPAQSMQKLVSTATHLQGPRHFDGQLPQPKAIANFYRDVAVLAFPTPGAFRIPNIQVKADYRVGFVRTISEKELPSSMVIARDRLVNLTSRMDASGHLVWDVPPGKWTVLRLGHTSTGVVNHPAPKTGLGLECDKLSQAGMDANFAGMMGKLIHDVGPAAGHALVRTHIDSWENGAQNWTADMRAEFEKRRGYDPLPFLPVVTGRVVGSLEISERFLWDLRQTVSDLVVEDYAGRMAYLAHQHGLGLSIEAYGGPCDDLPYAGRADEPMCEFWTGGGAFNTVKEMASAAHTYGKPILGAESFTSNSQERWLDYPATIKALGDRAFCGGVQRFVFHRYAFQPWNREYRPGMTMGPWGLHYERTETWWNWTRPWHEYLTRCQFLLRQGRFVADLCYLRPEAAPQGANPQHLKGYDYDECSAEVVLNRMSVHNGRLTLPNGMSYRLLVLPNIATMTPPLLRKIKELVQAGATVVGAPPSQSPSLTDYPLCDQEVKQLAGDLWGDCNGKTITQHRFGQGRVIWGVPPEKVLAEAGVPPDFASQAHLNYIHRTTGDAEIYFVANPQPYAVQAMPAFRVTGCQPELWWPVTGRMEPAAVCDQHAGRTRVLLPLGPSGSVFVVFHRVAQPADAVVSLTRNGKSILPTAAAQSRIVVQKAVYGVLTDPSRTRNVRAKVQHLVDAGEDSFQVARLAQGDDPAYGTVKTAVITFAADGKTFTVTGKDPETISLSPGPRAEPPAQLHRALDGRAELEVWQPGDYTLTKSSGKTIRLQVPDLPMPVEIGGPWTVRFAPHWGAPRQITLPKLISWSDDADPGVKYFSGTATYTKPFDLPATLFGQHSRLFLDLGDVKVMARVKLNGHDLGEAWKPPYRIDITDAARPGANTLQIQVVNLWVNRMIGDEQLPDDSTRNANGTLKAWPQWVLKNQPSPSGRYTFTTWRLWKKGSSLLPSGLLGPVVVKAAAEVPVKL